MREGKERKGRIVKQMDLSKAKFVSLFDGSFIYVL